MKRCLEQQILIVVLGTLGVWVSPAHAQLLQGSITGNITDTSAAAVAGAKVVATEQQTNFTRDTTTNAAGGYNLLTLPPGTYTVTVSAASFQTTTVTGVVVASEQITRRDVALTIGQLNQNVTVSAEANTLQTDRAEIRDELTTRALANVPVPLGRNYQMLFITLPGVSPPQNGNSFTANSSRGLSFNVNGGYSGTNSIRVDGTGTFNMTGLTVAQFIPSLEAIASVSVSGNSFDAEQSTGGGAVNITVKSGTNAIHGILFEDHTDQHLKAYPWPADRSKPNPKYINNQYGGTIGGPIKKDKLFYFMSYEGSGFSQSAPFLTQVPTAAMRRGDLSASPVPIYDPQTGKPDGSGRTPFVGNIIPADRIDQGVKNLLARPEWLLPNQAGTGPLGLNNNLRTNGNTYLRRSQVDGKIDWNPTQKFSMFVRLGWGNAYWTTPEQFGALGGPNLSNTNTAGGLGAGNVFNGTISGTYIIRPNMVFDAHMGYDVNIAYSKQPSQDQNLGATLMQIPGLSTAGQPTSRQLQQGGLPTLTIDGFGVLGSVSRFQPQDYFDPERNFDANFSLVKGSHDIRFGFDSDFQSSNEMQWQTPFGNYVSGAGGFHFAQGTTQLKGGPNPNDYNAFSSFLLGYPQDAGKVYQFPDQYFTRTKYFALYARDQWQVTPKLTVNYGLRADYFPFPGRTDSIGLEFYDNSTNNMRICGVAEIPYDCGISKYKLHFAPRLGIAYRIGSSTVIRAGYGISTDPINLLALGNRRENFPYLQGLILNSPNSLSFSTTLRQGIPTLISPDLTTGKVPVPANVGVYDHYPNVYKRGYIQTFNFTIEQRLRENWTASVAYAGSRQIDPLTSIESNWSPIGTGAAGQILNTPGLNGQPVGAGRTAQTPLLGVMGTTKYDSLQARTQARFSGVTINVGYTFSKNLGFPSGSVNAAAAVVQGYSAIPAFYRAKNYGPTPNDIPHNFQTTVIAELPFGKGKHWLSGGKAASIAGGWQLSGLFSDFSGRPFTAVAANATLNAVNSNQFADCVSTPHQTGDILHWYDPAAFAVPAAGRFGTCGQNSLRGPGLINADLGLERKITFKDRYVFAIRGEMFNVGNTPHHASPGFTNSTAFTQNNSVSNSAFMNATNIANTGRDGIDERTVRFSMKITF